MHLRLHTGSSRNEHVLRVVTSDCMDFREQVFLGPFTTFKIGGPARWFAQARTEADVLEGVLFARQHHVPLFVLGGGSNLLIADAGFPGLALHIATSGIQVSGDEVPSNEVSGNAMPYRDFSVAAGEDWDSFVTLAVEQNCGGIECLAGIPGTCGGTPIQNVGAYGQEVATTISRVRVLDRTTLECVELPATECCFAYRSSIFNMQEANRFIILRVDYRLQVAVVPMLAYKDLKACFSGLDTPSLAEVANAVRSIRNKKGMVLVPGESDSRSAGSFFKNPIVRIHELGRVAAAAGVEMQAVPAFQHGTDTVKLPAAWLLEAAGFHKGLTRGAAAISSRHTLALTNLGGATASELLLLRDEVVAGVEAKFGMRLAMEPVMVGF